MREKAGNLGLKPDVIARQKSGRRDSKKDEEFEKYLESKRVK